MIRRVILCSLALIAAGLGVWWFSANRHANAPAKAEAKVRDFIAHEQPGRTSRLEMAFHATPFGESAWLVASGLRGVQPSIPSYYLIDRDGAVHPMGVASLSKVMREEFQPTASDESFEERFILHLHHEQFIRLDSAAQIPGFDEKPLPADLAASIKPAVTTTDGTRVFFTYQQIGGWVRRYEFHYDPAGKFVEATTTDLGNRVGDARFYQ